MASDRGLRRRGEERAGERVAARMDARRVARGERVYGWSFYSQGTDRLASSDEFVDAALRRFGDTEPAPASPWDKGERLAALVRRERALLILDGVEPLQWGPGVRAGQAQGSGAAGAREGAGGAE